MNSQFDLHYHPSWDQNNFNKKEYAKALEDLSQRQDGSVLIVCDEYVSVASRVMAIWQTVKGWFGFENQASPIKVNYALLKLLRYGVNHHYFDDQTVIKILNDLQLNLSREQQYNPVTRMMDTIINQHNEASALIDRKISQIYQEQKDQLQEAFWNRLYHQYIAPIPLNTAAVKYNLGRITYSEGSREEAVAYLEQSLAIDPDNSDCRDFLAKAIYDEMRLQIGNGFWNDALQSAEKILRTLFADRTQLENMSEVFLYKFALEAKTNQILQALATMKSATVSIPDFLRNYEILTKQNPGLILPELQRVQLYHEIATQACQAGAFDQAIVLLEEALNEQPHSIPMRSKIAAHYISLGNYKVAMEHLLVALSINPDDAAVVLSLAQCHLGLREYVPAFECYLRAENICAVPNAYKGEKYFCCVQAASAFATYDDKYHATVYYNKALEIDPARGQELVSQLIDIADKWIREDYEQAMFVYRMALPYLEISYLSVKKQSEIYYLFAQDAVRRNSYDEAIEFFNKALNAQPNEPEVHFAISKCFFALNRHEPGEWHLERALALNPEQPEILIAKAELFERKNNIEEAIKIYQKLAWLNVNGVASIQNKKIVSMLVQIGDRHYIKGNSYPKNIQQSILKIINFVLHSEYNTEIENALGAWRGSNSWQNAELRGLGNYEDADHVLAEGRKLIAYLKNAYDGQRNHLRPEQMPLILKEKVSTLEKQLDEMLDYYNRMQELTDNFISFVKGSSEFKDITKALGGWLGEYSVENWEFSALDNKYKKLSDIESRAKTAVRLIETAYDGVPPHRLPREMTAAMRQQITVLRNFMEERLSSKHAIPYYLQAYNMDVYTFGEHLNRLVETFYNSQDYANAIGLYENLIKQFPRNMIDIPVDAYILHAESLFNNKNVYEAVNVLNRGIELFPNHAPIRLRLSQICFLIGEDLFRNQKKVNLALPYYNMAITAGTQAGSACYSSLADLYLEKYRTAVRLKNVLESSPIDHDSQRIIGLCLARSDSYLDNVVKYRKKAAKIGVENSRYQFDCAMTLFYDPKARKLPFKFIQRAIDLEPQNALFHYGAWHCHVKENGPDSQTAKQFVALPYKEHYVFRDSTNTCPQRYIPNPFEVPNENVFATPLNQAVEDNLDPEFNPNFRP